MVKARGGGGITAELEERLERGRTRTREENNINNNMDSSRKSRFEFAVLHSLLFDLQLISITCQILGLLFGVEANNKRCFKVLTFMALNVKVVSV